MRKTNVKAIEERSTFNQSCAVSVDIDATPERIWALLTNAADFPTWNSTVTKVTGRIAQGEKLQINVPVSDRTFKVKVVDFAPSRRMVWADGQAPMFRGVREYDLSANGSTTTFRMKETFSGLMLPMIRKTLPDFAPVFEQYAADLKTEAERNGGVA